jgi:acid stress-induced BolA-like protein IbaG/YrbA
LGAGTRAAANTYYNRPRRRSAAFRRAVFFIIREKHMTAAEVADLIRRGLPAADVAVDSADGTHFEAVIVAADFAGKSAVERHKLIYATLGAHMGRDIHALSMQTLTPAEADAE